MKKFRKILIATTVGVFASACASAEQGKRAQPSATEIAGAPVPPALQLVLASRRASGEDTFVVSVCDVPFPTADPIYGDASLRLPLQPATIARQLDEHIRAYFETISDGAYQPAFVTGETFALATTEHHDDCVRRAVAAAGAEADAVLVVATAEHLDSEPGGWGRPGTPCAGSSCSAAVTGRALYVGASDFHPDWGAVPLLDLIEHEIGHTLDLPHSGSGGGDIYTSALDVMSNSAAARQALPERDQRDRKDGADTLAINRVALGWLPLDGIAIADSGGGTFALSPSTGEAGLRLLVLPVDDAVFLTVEYRTASGYDSFLPEPGVSVHRIDQSPVACGRASTGGGRCTGEQRAQVALGSVAPHTDLLAEPGESWQFDGWTITFAGTPAGTPAGTSATVGVEVRPTAG